MKLKAVAWDIDGTLIDSEALHHRALLAACRALGADLSDLPDQAFRGVHMDDVWEAVKHRLPTATAPAAWIDAINRHYVENCGALTPLPNAVATVRRLFECGVAQVCVSNSSRCVVDANIEALGIGDAIAFSISLDDVMNGKPDPEPYLRACARLSLPPLQVAAVEDSRAGARSARAAGLYVVGFTPTGRGFDAVDSRIDRLDNLPALLGL